MPLEPSLHDIHSTRKLSGDEVSTLKSTLSNKINDVNGDVNQEDVSDLLEYLLAMVGNGKTVKYIVDELISMDMMEVCDHGMAENLGQIIGDYLKAQQETIGDDGVAESAAAPPRLVSLKASSDNNALTNAGALGPSRDKSSADKKTNNDLSSPSSTTNQRQLNRSLASAAFNRLIKQNKQDQERNKKKRGGRGGNNNSTRNNNNNNNRHTNKENNKWTRPQHSKQQNSKNNNNNNAGQRRKEPEDDFIAAPAAGRITNRTARQPFPKRQRRHPPTTSTTTTTPTVATTPPPESRAPTTARGRGRSSHASRGRSSRGGRGAADGMTSGSPLLAASFAVASSFGGVRGGRGTRGRGRGRGRGGRGERIPGRTEVAGMLAEKTWVRKATMDGSLVCKR